MSFTQSNPYGKLMRETNTLVVATSNNFRRFGATLGNF